jgi:hypothetical protein
MKTTTALGIGLFVTALLFFSPANAQTGISRSQALASCQATIAADLAANPNFNGSGAHCRDNSTSFSGFLDAGENLGAGFYPYDPSLPNPPTCSAGQVVSPGTNVLQSSTSGEMCTTGANSCEISLKIGEQTAARASRVAMRALQPKVKRNRCPRLPKRRTPTARRPIATTSEIA